MACAAALPAADLPAVAAGAAAAPLPQPALVASLSGILLEIATPPPRTAWDFDKPFELRRDK
jgi:hypothetical protein